MDRAALRSSERHGIRLRTVAVPAEHGGWGFLLEPIVLGLLLSPTMAGLCLALATAGGFLARHPLKLFLHDRRRSIRTARLSLAWKVALSYLALSLVAVLGAYFLSGLRPLLPLFLASPLAAAYLVYESRSEARSLAAELTAPCALAAAAPAIVLAGGWAGTAAAALWALLIARAVPTILYVRARLRLERSGRSDTAPVLLGHAGALLLVGALWWVGLVPLLGLIAIAAIAARAAYGLSAQRSPATAKQVGLQEVGWGCAFVLIVLAGYWM